MLWLKLVEECFSALFRLRARVISAPLQLIARCACFAQRAKMLSALSDYSSKGSVRTLELVEKY
jgi:hypothetical protein